MRDGLLLADIIGYSAGILTSISMIPEIYKTWRTKEARDLSFYWLVSLGIGEVLWIIYGLYISSLPVMITNAASLALVITQITLAFRYDKAK